MLSPARICFDIVKDERPHIALLIGAGCSKTAGIPLASEMVDDIWGEEKYAKRLIELQDDKKRSYPAVVGRLSRTEYLKLFRHSLDAAKVNLAHLCIAELLAKKVVNRILTTNFDSLLVQACAIAGVQPAIYDCVAVPDLEPVLDDEQPALYYLHGQSYGLRMVNTDWELKEHSSPVREVIYQSILKQTVIVVGCSAAPDGVLQHLTQVHTTGHIIWVPHTESDALEAVAAFDKTSGTRWVLENYDADDFFHELLRALNLDRPRITYDLDGFARQVRKRIVDELPDWFPRTRAERAALASGPVAPETPGAALPKPPPANWTTEVAGSGQVLDDNHA